MDEAKDNVSIHEENGEINGDGDENKEVDIKEEVNRKRHWKKERGKTDTIICHLLCSSMLCCDVSGCVVLCVPRTQTFGHYINSVN